MIDNDLLSQLDVAKAALADYLKDGSLCLVLGAGASRTLGFPLWWELIRDCSQSAGLKDLITSTSSNDDLRLVAERIEDKVDRDDFLDLVAGALYKSTPYESGIIFNKQLIALGALLMGSKRGHIQSVVNFNFDDSLEWYLRLHGFSINVVTKLPRIARNCDVTIYHPHGYLPLVVGGRSDFLILSQFSFDRRMGARKDLWKETIVGLLRTQVGLFYGISGSDPEMGPLLSDLGQELGTRPVGFWLLSASGDRENDYFKRRNIVPLRFSSFDDIPDFLLSICQAAADSL